MFYEALHLFLEDTMKEDTLEDVLLELGWERKRRTMPLQPPKVSIEEMPMPAFA